MSWTSCAAFELFRHACQQLPETSGAFSRLTRNNPGLGISTNVIFRSISVERDFGTLEHHQQLGLVFVQPFEQTVERDEARFEREDAVEPRLQDRLASLARTATVGLQSAVVLPDQVTDVALGRAVFVGEGVELVNEPFCVHLIWSSR